MKKLLPVVVALLTALVLVLAACGGDDDGTTDTAADNGTDVAAQEVEVLLSFPKGIAWAPLLVAENQGYFEEEGITPEFEEVDGSGFVVQQMIAGNFDFGWAAADSIIIGFGSDPGLRAIMCNQERNIFRIVVPEGSPIQSVDDLAGQTLGFTEAGGGEEPMVAAALSLAGIEDDVTLAPIGPAGPASQNAIESGQVDAYATSYPDISALTGEGMVFTDITPETVDGTPGDCMVTTEDVLADEANLDLVKSIARAWAKGSHFAIANPEAALQIACEEVPEECANIDVARAYMNDTIELLQPADPGLPVGGLDLESWQQSADILTEAGSVPGQVDVTDLVASSQAQEVNDEVLDDIDTDAVSQDAAQYGG